MATIDEALLLARTRHQAKALAEAEDIYRRILVAAPERLEAWGNLGNVLRDQGRFDEAVACYRKAIEIKPDSVEAHLNLGGIFLDAGEVEDALASYCSAALLRPASPEAHNGCGAALLRHGHLDEAVAAYRRAVVLRPDYAEAHCNLALALLKQGNLAEGWREYQYRLQLDGFARPNFPGREWDGRDHPGDTILLYTEQGFGDTLQMLRFVPEVAARFAKVLIGVRKPLLRLVGQDRVQMVADGQKLEFQHHYPLMSLPYLLGIGLDTIPAALPYLAVPEPEIARWRGLLPARTGLRIGLVWAGSAAYSGDRDRSLRFEHLAGLLATERATFLSLQKGPRAADCLPFTGNGRLIPIAEALDDFADTAAAISALDLVITVDTAVAHLAGALGKPLWIMLPHNADWRWLTGRSDSPWYHSARLFRQQARGDWDGTVVGAARELQVLIASRRH